MNYSRENHNLYMYKTHFEICEVRERKLNFVNAVNILMLGTQNITKNTARLKVLF